MRNIAEEFPKVFYINREINNNRLMEEQALTEEKLIDLLNNSEFNKQKYCRLIIDNDLKKFLSLAYCDIHYLECENNIGICIVRTDDELYVPDNYTKKQLIKGLIYRDTGIMCSGSMNIMRRAIPAFEEYSKLAVMLKNVFGIGTDKSSKWKIISPISLDDFEKMHDFSKESFVEYVVTKPIFDNLVDYVVKNGKKQNSKEVIIDTYKKLIREFYDIEIASHMPQES